jgi:hypothetical protein
MKTTQEFNIFNPDGTVDHEMLQIAARHYHKASNDAEMEKALVLSEAGWTPVLDEAHTPHPFTGSVDVMSWYWRRPPLGRKKVGRLFDSTNQAFNALKKEQGA